MRRFKRRYPRRPLSGETPRAAGVLCRVITVRLFDYEQEHEHEHEQEHGTRGTKYAKTGWAEKPLGVV